MLLVFTLSGTITYPRSVPATGLIVRAYDKDMRSEELLGQAVVSAEKGYYEITYTPDQFRRADKGTADLFIRVVDQKGKVLGKSEVLYNAGERAQINLVLEPVQEEVEEKPLSEFERMLLRIAPVQEEIPPRDFTEEDIHFLNQELALRKELPAAKDILKKLLEYLRLSDQLEQESGWPMAAFYGWLRLEVKFSTLKELAGYSPQLLMSKLTDAIGRNIIPDVLTEYPNLLESLQNLPYETGKLKAYTFSAKLIEKDSKEPLSSEYRVIVTEKNQDAEDLVSTHNLDGAGYFEAPYYFDEVTPESDAKLLSFQVQDEDDEKIVATFERSVHPKEGETETIEIDLRAAEDEAPAVRQLVSDQLAIRLQQMQVHNLQDVLLKAEQVEALGDDPEISTLLKHARWSVVEKDLEVHKVLINAGYSSLLDVANETPERFVRKMHQGLKGDAKAAKLHLQAQNYRLFLNNYLTEKRIQGGGPVSGDNGEIDERLGRSASCECADCKSGVSVLAYLTDLLAYATKTVKARYDDDEVDLNTGFFTAAFQQPFNTLPARCSSVDEKIRQMRLNIEVMRRLEPDTLPVIDFIDTATYELLYQQYLVQTYHALLNLLGTSVDELQLAQPQGASYSEAELNDQRRQAIASKIGVSVENLPAMYLDPGIQPLPITENWLESIFGLVSTLKDPFLERPKPQLLQLQIEKLWASWLEQDWPEDPYQPDRDVPLIDPYLIDESYLRGASLVPPASSQVFTLWTQRKDAIEAYMSELRAQIATGTTLQDIIQAEFRVSWTQVQDLQKLLYSGQSAPIFPLGRILRRLSVAAIDRLVALTLQLLSYPDLNAPELEPQIQEWVEILGAAHKKSLYPDWLNDELNGFPPPRFRHLSSRYGFQLPLRKPQARLSWLADPTERDNWEKAFRQQHSLPILDPNQVDDSELRYMRLDVLGNPDGNSPALRLWRERKTAQNQRKIELNGILDSVATDLEKFSLVLGAADAALGWSESELQELIQQDQAGISVQKRLEQLQLNYPRFAFLKKIQEKISNGGAAVTENEWVQVIAIVLQCEKMLEYPQWRWEEQQEGISISPAFFYLKETINQEEEGTPIVGYHLNAEEKTKLNLENQWLRNIPAHSEWKSTLKARIDQVNTLQNSLLALVDNAEEQTLTLLQDAMVFKVTIEEKTLEKKKQILAEKRLLNMDIGPCHKTTRVAEAIRVLQTLLWAIHTDTLSSTQLFSWGFSAGRPGVDAFEVADSFEADWQWMGSYPAWRAAMFVFLYPQNYLDPVIRPFKSWGFDKVEKKLTAPVTPEKACEVASLYSEYFEDITDLKIQSNCQIDTTLKEKSKDGGCTTQTVVKKLVHVFGINEKRGKIYRAIFEQNEEVPNFLTSWTPITEFENATKIVGTTPHETPDGKRYILIFAKVTKNRKNVLQLLKYNLDDPGARFGQITDLDLPKGAEQDFQAVAVQKFIKKPEELFHSPTIVLFKVPNGRIISQRLNEEATDWLGESWIVAGKNTGQNFSEILAFISLNNKRFFIFLRSKTKKIFARIFNFEFGKGNSDTSLNGKDSLWGIWNAWHIIEESNLYGVYPKFLSDSIAVLISKKRSLNAVEIDESIPKLYPFAVIDFYRFVEIIESYFGIDIGSWRFQYEEKFPSLFYYEGFQDQFRPLDLAVRIDKSLNEIWDIYGESWEKFLNEIFQNSVKSSDLESDAPYYLNPNFSDEIKRGIEDKGKKTKDLNPDEKRDIVTRKILFPIILSNLRKQFDEYIKTSDYYDERGDWRFTKEHLHKYITPPTPVYAPNSSDISEFDDKLSFFLEYFFNFNEFAKRSPADEHINEPKFLLGLAIESYNTVSGKPETDSNGFKHFGHITKRNSKKINETLVSLVPSSSMGESFSFVTHENGQYFISPSITGPSTKITMNDSKFSKVKIAKEEKNTLLDSRRETIKALYPKYVDSDFTRNYLYEYFHGVIITIAIRLQRAGFYQEALEWFKNIYDFNAPYNERIIDHLLFLNSANSVSSNFTRSENWLSDPLDPHGIAKGRKDSYTSYVVQQIIRCLVEYADAEFTIDNVESNEHARRLYEKALELFNTTELYFSAENNCGKLLREFEIEVLLGYKFAIPELRTPLLKIRDFKKLENTLTGLRRINQTANQSPAEKVAAMYSLVQQVVQEQPGVKTLGAIMSQGEQDLQKLEPWVLSRPTIQAKLHKSLRRKGTHALNRIANFANTTRETLENTVVYLPALRGSMRRRIPTPPRPHPGPIPAPIPAVWWTGYSFVHSLILPISFEFCVPQNPILSPLYERASINLFKLNHCMNIAGMKRDLQPYAAATDSSSGMPTLGQQGQWNLPGVYNRIGNKLLPTLYRYAFLINRAKELTQLAMQIEASLLAALEKRDEESLRLLQARQSVEMAQMSVRLQDLRVTEAFQGIVLAGLQQDRSTLQANYYQGLLSGGMLYSESLALDLLEKSKTSQYAAAGNYFAAAAIHATLAPLAFLQVFEGKNPGYYAAEQTAAALSATGSGLSAISGALSTESSMLSTQASYDRRTQDWAFQKKLAEQDLVIGAQQIQLAKIHTQIAQQEREISIQQVAQAQEILQFLLNKTTGYALYDWMVGILKQSYNYFLQMATATARLAENQLSFERQETAPAIIQTNYWNMPGYTGSESKELGLTGSTRLMTDLSKLDQYALDTDQRKSHFMVRLSFAQFFPLELQQLRETGQMTFATTLQMIEERFPGAYLCQIKEVALSVIALTDPVEGIKAMLYSSGVSRVVVGPYTFQTININRSPEMNVYSGAAIDNTGRFDLIADQSATMFLPFENAGFETLWQLDLPRNANAFNFESIADVIISIKCTALFSMDYQSQVLKRLQKEFSAVRTFSFRTEFADQWYDLHHPDLSANPMVVTFNTGRTDFPSRMQNIRIQQIALYFVKADNALFEVPVNALLFAEEATSGRVGGSAQTNERMINTRFGNGASWVSMIGRKPIGEWELDLTGTLEGIEGYLSDGNPLQGLSVRDLFEQGEIRDVLFAVTYSGVRPL